MSEPMYAAMVESEDLSTVAEPAIVSPELALVDANLAAWLRGRGNGLVVRPTPTAPAEASVASVDMRISADDPDPAGDASIESTTGWRRKRRLAHLVAAAALAGLVVLAIRHAAPVPVERSAVPLAGQGRQPEVPSTTATRVIPPPPTGPEQPLAKRRFAWAPVDGASGYRVELFRGDERVFSTSTTHPALSIPAHWTYGGIRRSLQPGEYRWYVWPVISGARSARAIVQASLVIE